MWDSLAYTNVTQDLIIKAYNMGSLARPVCKSHESRKTQFYNDEVQYVEY